MLSNRKPLAKSQALHIFRKKIPSQFARRPHLELLESRFVFAAGIAVADYQFTNHGLNGQTELFSRDIHDESVASDITSPLSLGSTGNGEPPRGLALGGAFDETAEPTPATNNTDYFSFTISPNLGKALSLAELSFSVRRNDPDSKNSFSVYYDNDPGAGGDNFTTRLVAGVVAEEDQFETTVVELEGMADFADITTPITFRYYSWGTAGLGTQRIDNVRVRAVAEAVDASAFAYYGDANRLVHPLDAQGNRIADFSSAGYMNGSVPIPDIAANIDSSRIIDVTPVPGDDMANIQSAIDQIAAMEPDASGFRGVVQLSAGEFEVSDQLQILQSGIVLRGVGDEDDAFFNTILRATGTEQRSLIVVGPNEGFSSGVGSSRNILDKYVPVGAKSFRVDSTVNWKVGDRIVVRRPSTDEWIAALGMDSIPPRSDGNPVTQWAAGQYDHLYERVITRIDDDRIQINAPLHSALDQEYGGGTAFEYEFPRIEQIGIENIRGVSDYAFDTDEDHARTFIELRAVQDAWVTNITAQHFIYSTVHATSRALRVTVDDARSLEPKSIITGGRRYAFNIDGQFVLMQNLYSEEGRHDFVNNARTRNRGPNVFLNGSAINSHSTTGPHQRFSTGTLYDSISTDNQTEARNRGNFGSGHGWAGANMVFWNNSASSYLVQNPPTAQNWLIGSVGSIVDDQTFGSQPPATVDAHGTPINFGREDNPTGSLYVAQRNQSTSEASFELRELVLGDFDLAEYDGANSQDAVYVEPSWANEIQNLAGSVTVAESDESYSAQFVPLSFEYCLDTNEVVYSAVLSLGLRGLGGDTTGDLLHLDSLEDSRTFASLGLTTSLPSDTTSVLTLELTADEMNLLNDGLLNLAVSQNSLLDWAHLDLRTGDASSFVFDIQESTVREGGIATTATLTRSGPTNEDLTVHITSSDVGEALVPASITIAAGESISAPFAITPVDDGVRDKTQSVTLTASASSYENGRAIVEVIDLLGHRTSELTIRVQDPDGNPIPDALVDIQMSEHAFKFGTQVRDRMFAITEAEYNALSETQKQNLLPNLESQFGIPRYTPTWQDILNYRNAIFQDFNHVVPTTGMQWVAINNSGTSVPDAAFELAHSNGLTATGASVVWQRDRWPTPDEFRPAANPNPQVFHQALIDDRLGDNGVLIQFSESGSSPNVADWKLLNEPIHEHYYRDTFIDAGIYNSEVETLADYFQRAEELRPDATLSINEFNIINSASDDATIEYRDLIQSLQDVGAPIDRIGIQAHIARNDITKNDIARRLNILAETGLPIEISEFDSRDDANQLNEEEQEQMFRDMLEATFENPAIDGFIMWGIWDIAHWRGNAPLYDINWNLKPEAAPWTELVLGEWMPNLSAQGVDSSGVWDSSGNLFRGTYQISASASGISAGITDFTLSADQELTITLELPSLSLAIAEDAVPENGGKSLVTLTRNTETVDPLTVNISANDSSKLSVPTEVTIPAGASSVNFMIDAQDDELVDGDQIVSLQAAADGFSSAFDSILVTDDDIPTITLEIMEDSISENDETATVRVSRNTGVGQELLVNLNSSDTSEATVPMVVAIPANSSQTEFQLASVNDAIVDGSQTVQITASAAEHADGIASIEVTDDDVAMLNLEIQLDSIDENGGVSSAVVSRNSDVAIPLVVQIVSSEPDRINLPDSLLIPTDSFEASFAIAAVNDVIVGEDSTIQITVTATTHIPANDTITVLEDDVWTWTNPIEPLDVNADGAISAIDALLVIDFLNSGRDSELPPLDGRPEAFFDVSRDGFVSAIDALLVISRLNSRDGEGESGVQQKIVFAHQELKRRLRLEAWDNYFADHRLL